MKTRSLSRDEPTAEDREALHAAFVAAPANASGLDDDRPEKVLRTLAERHAVPLRYACMWAQWGEWYIERAASYARARAARQHPNAPLDLEGFAAYYAESHYSHLDRPQGLAWGRHVWFQALAPIAHWEAARMIAAGRQAAVDARAAARKAA
jgi:hypothetical protein